MTEYVLVFPFILRSKSEQSVLLILKDRPNSQKGRLNLLGGKIESGETPEQAAVRELKEESGLSAMGDRFPELVGPYICGKIVGDDFIVYCVSCYVLDSGCGTLIPREGETEKVQWHQFWQIKGDPRLLPNLKIIIPMMQQDVRGWTIVSPKDSGMPDSKFEIFFDSVN